MTDRRGLTLVDKTNFIASPSVSNSQQSFYSYASFLGEAC